jgi:serine protease Do
VHLPRLPDWLVYLAIVAALVIGSMGRREKAPPPPPPPMAGDDAIPLDPSSPFDPAVVVDVPGKQKPGAGTAFSVADTGVWMTARHVVDGCTRIALVVAEGRGVAAKAIIDPSGEAAILTTEGGAPALPLAGTASSPRPGALGFHPGYPQGQPGEAVSRLLGRENLVVRGRGARTEPVLAWAEIGRTETLKGTLAGLSGAPVLDSAGRVIGVTVAEAPRRGRIYTTAP